LSAENRNLKNLLADKQRELEDLAKTGRVIGFAIILPSFPPLQGWSMLIALGAFAVAFVAVGMGVGGVSRNRRQIKAAKNAPTMPPNRLINETRQLEQKARESAARIQTLQDEAILAKKALEEAAGKVKAAEASAANIQFLDAERKRKLNDYDSMAGKLETALADVARMTAEVKAAKDASDGSAHDLRAKLIAAADRASAQQVQIDTLNANLGEARAKLDDVERLEAELQNAINANESWQSECGNLQEQLKTLKGELNAANAKVVKLEDGLGRANERLVFLRASYRQTLGIDPELNAASRGTDSPTRAIIIDGPSSANNLDAPRGASSSVNQDLQDQNDIQTAQEAVAFAQQPPMSAPPKTRPGIGLMDAIGSELPSLMEADQDADTTVSDRGSSDGIESQLAQYVAETAEKKQPPPTVPPPGQRQVRWTPPPAAGTIEQAYAELESPTKAEGRHALTPPRSFSTSPDAVTNSVFVALKDPSVFHSAFAAITDEEFLTGLRLKIVSFVPDVIASCLKILAREISLRRSNGTPFESDIVCPEDVIAWHNLATLRLVFSDSYRLRLPQGISLAGTDLQLHHFAAPALAAATRPEAEAVPDKHVPTMGMAELKRDRSRDSSPDIKIQYPGNK